MNERRVWVHPGATAETEAAVCWYRERSATAADRLVEEINQAIDRILEAPQRWPAGFRGTRKVKLPCFPFLVIYRESDDTLAALAIAHARRRPEYWQERA
jgi:plasmid stabilization system protein ParE